MITRIYVLCDPVGEIRYIGKTCQPIARRFSAHLCDARRGVMNYRCNWIRSILSSGFLPVISLLGEVDGDGSKEETAWIVYGKQEGWRLVNGTEGGGGASGYTWSECQRKKASISHLGKRATECTRLKMRNSQIKSWTLERRKKSEETQRGRVVTSETRHKLSIARLGRKHTSEAKKKISDALKGHVLSEESKRKIGLGNKGKIISPAQRLKISLTKRSRR